MSVINEFNMLYEKYLGDSEKAIDELVKSSPTLELMASITITYRIIDDEAVLYKVIENGKETCFFLTKHLE